MPLPQLPPLLHNRLDVHDRKQFEIKLEYQPAPGPDDAEYLIEAFLFLPRSLNITSETYVRQDVYADILNYVRLKTPVVELGQMLQAGSSPLVRLERWDLQSLPTGQPELIYQAKMLSCVFRGALRRFAAAVAGHAEGAEASGSRPLEEAAPAHVRDVRAVLERFRAWGQTLAQHALVQERTRASVRLVDEYMSLSVEQFFRRTVADTLTLPQTPALAEMRKAMLQEVLREERYRKDHQLRSVLSPTGDNEEYMHRIGFLKKFCMNILFLTARRDSGRRGWEEILFAFAAGLAMAFALLVALVGQRRFPQASLNFSLILVVGYMFKDRIKEALRRTFASFANRHLFDRGTDIHDPVTQGKIGHCKEKVDYDPPRVPQEVLALRSTDDFVTVSQGELSETVIRYQKKVRLDAELLNRMPNGCTGVTDIIRLNVERLLRDMDDPELALEYVDQEDLTVGRVRGAKSYQVDLVFRFHILEGERRETDLQAVRLVLDRNGIKRMLRLAGPRGTPPPVRSAAA